MFPEMNKQVLALVEETFEDETYQWYELCCYNGEEWLFDYDPYNITIPVVLKWRYCEECFE